MITFLEFLDYKENNNLSSDEYAELQSTLKKMMSDNLDLGNFVSNLKQFISNPKFIDFLKSGDENDALKITRKNIPVADLIPTQDEIFLESSLDNGLTDRFGNLAQFLDGNAQVKGYVVTCMVNGSVFILDGHHRWSQYFLFNPQSEVPCLIIENLNSYLRGLKIAHLAVAAKLSSVPSASGSETNLFTIDYESFENHIKNIITEKSLQIFIDKNLAKNVDDVVDFLWNNVLKIRKYNLGKESRGLMPQTGGAAKGFEKDLEQGKINVIPDWLTLSGLLAEN